MPRPPRVVFVVLDAFPYGYVDPTATATLAGLRSEGTHVVEGGRAVLSASTYPNHASFVTGVDPVDHGILTSNALTDTGFEKAHRIGPTAPTWFDECATADRRAVAVFGDQYLIGVCGALAADAHWPPDGRLPEGTQEGELGYGADTAVASAIDSVRPTDADFVMIQLDEVDTARHLYGSDSDEAMDQCRSTDAALGQVLERFRPDWDETVVIVVSDHDNEPVSGEVFDLESVVAKLWPEAQVHHDGTSALVVGDVPDAKLLELDGVSGLERLSARHTIVWGEPGSQYGVDWGLKGHHGSPRTARQLVVIGGGHTSVPEVATWADAERPVATDWAPVVRSLLGNHSAAISS